MFKTKRKREKEMNDVRHALETNEAMWKDRIALEILQVCCDEGLTIANTVEMFDHAIDILFGTTPVPNYREKDNKRFQIMKQQKQ